MAVWWLDIARYADTVGFHGDQNQRIFPYRDYVINAFNQNKSFDQFTIEQLAGDLLPNPTTEQQIATGYNRLNMMTREGGAQPAEYLAKYGAERVRSVSAAWFGSTFGCAECHDHKFDPIKTRDFYEMQSFFADMKQWGVYSDYGYTPNPELKGFKNEYPFPPEIEVETPYFKKKLAKAKQALSDHLESARDQINPKAFEAWHNDTRQFLTRYPDGWITPNPLSAAILKKGKIVAKRSTAIAEDGSVKPDRSLGKDESLEMVFDTKDLSSIAAIKVDLITEGASEKAIKSSLGKSVKLSVYITSPNGKKRKAGTEIANATVKRRDYRSGKEVYGIWREWKLPFDKLSSQPQGIWLLDVPSKLKPDQKITLSISGNCPLALKAGFSPLGALDPLNVSGRETLPQDKFLFSTAIDRPAYDKARKLAAEIREWNDGRAWSLITESVAKPRTVRILPRGNFLDTTGLVVLPATHPFCQRAWKAPNRRG